MRVLVLLSIVVLAACNEDSDQGGVNDAHDSAEDTADSAGGDATEDVADTAHEDTAADTAHADTAHEDTAHEDTAHADTSEDTTHDDTAHADTSEDTTHDDTTHADTSEDTTHDDTTPDTAGGACHGAEDCTLCAFDKPVAGPDDCYCVFCPVFPLSQAECHANQASWTQHCDPWPKPAQCPVPMCLQGAAPICDDGRCVADPNGCFSEQDCGSCRFGDKPEVPEDCHCPMCPVPLATTYCEEIELAVSDVCAGFDFDACLPPPCPFPPPITCTDAKTCGYGGFEPR